MKKLQNLLKFILDTPAVCAIMGIRNSQGGQKMTNNLTESQKIEIAKLQNTESKIDSSVTFEEKYKETFVALIVKDELGYIKTTYMIGKRGKVEIL